MDLAQLQKSLAGQGHKLPPVEQWQPDFCGNIDMRIKTDGSWWYMGTPIGRDALVTLFSSVLKKEDDNYFLVTPVEKVGIQVDDVPFVITQWQQQNSYLVLTNKQGDKVIVSKQNPCKLRPNQLSKDLLPYVRVRANLWARLHQNVYYQLAEVGEPAPWQGSTHLMLKSGDYRFSLGKLAK